MFLVRNSWGPDWGDKGYCYIPYAYLTNAEWTHDLWTLRRAHNLNFAPNEVYGERGEHVSFFSGKAE
jgi:C1A family cysteine protease